MRPYCLDSAVVPLHSYFLDTCDLELITTIVAHCIEIAGNAEDLRLDGPSGRYFQKHFELRSNYKYDCVKTCMAGLCVKLKIQLFILFFSPRRHEVGILVLVQL